MPVPLYLAEVDLIVNLTLHVVHVIVDHWKGDEHRYNGHYGEGDGGVGHEAVGFDTSIQIHD